MWSKFDQTLDDELQPLWLAVLLWRDIQIRLTVIRPTFPVIAFEAPGALGCEKPASIIRRSDQRSGWEYAEVDGHAVAIQRLSGYDCQQASAPFLDQSNINLAYSYSEQPMVYESQASVAARCFAAASLIRPAAFDPAHEFSGIKVEIESPEIFYVQLADERSAFVAPGETTPRRLTVNGLEMEGTGIRYVQTSQDLNEICGLGVTAISGLATFDRPATFRLKRISERVSRVTIDTGFSLGPAWLRGDARAIEVLALNGQWTDITDQCRADSVPGRVVQAWSEHNQRTLVDFRITP
jgi:hypothetical protein